MRLFRRTPLGGSFALAGIAALAFASGTPVKAQSAGDSREISPDLQAILAEARFGRKVSASAKLPVQVGFARGGTALYITPEVGVNAPPGSDLYNTALSVAKGFNANFIPTHFASLPNTTASFTALPANTPVRDIYVFTTQGNVLSAAPTPAGPSDTNANYSPLWQVNLVSWNSGKTPRPLTSEADILNARSAGEVTIVPGATTGITVECSVIFTPQGGLLPGAKIALSRTRNQDEG